MDLTLLQIVGLYFTIGLIWELIWIIKDLKKSYDLYYRNNAYDYTLDYILRARFSDFWFEAFINILFWIFVLPYALIKYMITKIQTKYGKTSEIFSKILQSIHKKKNPQDYI